MKKIFLYSLAIALLASCNEKKVENAEQDESALSELRSVTVDKKYELQLPDSLKYADDRFFSELNIFISWPEKINGKTPTELQQRILAKAFDERKPPYKNLEVALNTVKSEPLGYAGEPGVTQKEISAIPDGELRISTLLVEAYPAYMNSRLWTYYVMNYFYPAGAAHGVGKDYYVNYDVKNGKVVTIGQLFSDMAAVKECIDRELSRNQQYEGYLLVDEVPNQLYHLFRVQSLRSGRLCSGRGLCGNSHLRIVRLHDRLRENIIPTAIATTIYSRKTAQEAAQYRRFFVPSVFFV